MAVMTDLAAILRGAGLPVREIPGWRTRGHGTMGEILGVLVHHTAGPATGNYPSERVVVSGRPGLAGPLAQLGLARDGTWIVIAAGQAWHAGTGSASFVPRGRGNTHLIGVEAESTGVRDDWTVAQRAGYPRGVAAVLRAFGLGSYRAIGHKEWAPGRKIDPAFWDMNEFRAQVARAMRTPGPPAPTAPVDAVRATQAAVHVDIDGRWGPATDSAVNRVRAAARGALGDIRALQAAVGTPVDGDWGPNSKTALDQAVRALQAAWGTPADGAWGPNTDRAWSAARAEHYRAAAAPAPPPREEDDMFTDEDRALLRRVHHEATLFLGHRRDPGQDKPADTVLGFAASAEGRAARIERYTLAIAEQQQEILAAVTDRSPVDPEPIVAAIVGAGIAEQVVEALARRLAAAPGTATEETPS